MQKENNATSDNERVPLPRLIHRNLKYQCSTCSMKFPTTHALGGHQNAHRLRQNLVEPALYRRPVASGDAISRANQLPTAGESGRKINTTLTPQVRGPSPPSPPLGPGLQQPQSIMSNEITWPPRPPLPKGQPPTGHFFKVYVRASPNGACSSPRYNPYGGRDNPAGKLMSETTANEVEVSCSSECTITDPIVPLSLRRNVDQEYGREVNSKGNEDVDLQLRLGFPFSSSTN